VDLFQNFHNVNDIAENAPTTLLFTTTSFRMLNFYWNRMRYVNLIKNLDEIITNLQKYSDRETKQIISKSVTYMRRLTIIFWIFALITANSMCIKSMIGAILYEHGAFLNNEVCSIKACRDSNFQSYFHYTEFHHYRQAPSVDTSKLFSEGGEKWQFLAHFNHPILHNEHWYADCAMLSCFYRCFSRFHHYEPQNSQPRAEQRSRGFH
jgi:7tm Odorant receptor